MQGVNVVARWIDPATKLLSRSVVATSISGFLFCGNAGNMISGYTDSSGQDVNRFGSDDQTLEGFFDLAGLQIPNGATSAQYQITAESVDPLWSPNAGPYGSAGQVQPSGSVQPIILTVTPGANLRQDILMQGSAAQKPQWYGATSYAFPVQMPGSGMWAGTLSAYGVTDFFQFPAKANRTLSVIVHALDELGNPSAGKVLPVPGMWDIADPGLTPAPANSSSAFNTSYFAETRLDAQLFQSTTFRLGITDYRGDGRPDYRYQARVLYGDNVFPARASVAGGTPVTIAGLGLQSDTLVQTAGIAMPVWASSGQHLLVASPSLVDGIYDLLLSDVNTGGSSSMTGVLTIGAGPGDQIKLISGPNLTAPVGAQASSPFTVSVVAADGVSPVVGASVQFTSSPAVAFSACGSMTNCTLLSDQSGLASTFVTVQSVGNMTVTAKLAPATYPTPQQVQVTLLGTSSQLDLSLLNPSVWIAQGATLTLPLDARVLSNGRPVTGARVNYQVTAGAGTLSSAVAQTDANGNVFVNVQVNVLSAALQVTVCVASGNNACQVFSATVVPVSSLQVDAVAGTLQVVPSAAAFQPVMVRVTDASVPPNPVLGAGVLFLSYIGRLSQNQPIVWAGETGISQPGMPVILAKSQTTLQSDINGLATFSLSTQGISGNVAVVGTAAVGNSSVQFEGQQLGP